MSRGRRHSTLLARALVAMLAASRVAPACAASFQGLGDLPGGPVEGYAIGVSADGQFVAGHSQSSLGDEAFVWSEGDMAPLGDLPTGSFSSFATMASSGGSYAVGYGTVTGGYRPFRWTSGSGMVVLGDLPGGGSNGFATGMSADGSVVSGQSTSTLGTEAFVWTPSGGMAGLGDLPGGAFDSSAWVVSADGLVVAGDGTTAAGRQAFVWTAASGLVPLGYLPGGGAFSGAHGVSNGGTYVAGASDSSNASPGNVEAFRWSAAGGMTGLGDLPGGPVGSFANGMSADGQVIVGGSETSLGTEAYVWTPSCGMRHLETYLLSLGVTSVASWTLQNAHGVSADGTAIVGYGINPSGRTEPWIAHAPVCAATAGTVPDGASVPGPALTVEKDFGDAIRISWSASCDGSDTDYEVYEGMLGIPVSHVPRICATGGTIATIVPADGNRYYLAVASEGAVEGSYGRTSAGAERPPSVAACRVQAIAACP